MQILFMGMGQMGRRMVARLNRDETVIWNRTPSVLAEMAESGGWRVADDLKSSVAHSAVVITMLKDDTAVESLGAAGLYEALAPDTLWIDMTTGAPDATRRYTEVARWRQARFVAAPVLGSLKPATEGKLLVLAGGDSESLASALPILSRFGRVVEVESAEQALTAKLAVNAVLAFYVNGVAEALEWTDQVGLTRSMVLDLLAMSSVATPLLQAKAPRWEQHDYAPEFPISMLHKDLKLAQNWAESLSVLTPGLDAIEGVYKRGTESAWADRDMAGIGEALSHREEV